MAPFTLYQTTSLFLLLHVLTLQRRSLFLFEQRFARSVSCFPDALFQLLPLDWKKITH